MADTASAATWSFSSPPAISRARSASVAGVPPLGERKSGASAW
jgi:hypothetical protein